MNEDSDDVLSACNILFSIAVAFKTSVDTVQIGLKIVGFRRMMYQRVNYRNDLGEVIAVGVKKYQLCLGLRYDLNDFYHEKNSYWNR